MSKDEAFDLHKEGLILIDYVDNSVLMLASDRGIDYLSSRGVGYRALDEDPLSGHYYLAASENDLSTIDFSTGISIYPVGAREWLIKISQASDLYELNRHPLELKRVNFDPPVRPEPLPAPRSLARDTIIQHMVDAVAYDTIIHAVQNLQSFITRYSPTDSARACADWLMAKFVAYGYDTVYFDTFQANYAPNVVAVKYGMVHPPGSYVVGCAHFDCTSEMPSVLAPGADDNASGTAGVLEMARILRDHQFEYGIYLIAFCGEEQGLVGSEYFAARAYQQGNTIVGTVNLDMFAFSTAGRDTFTIINDTSYINNLWLAAVFAACADTYTTLKKKVWTGRRPYSDHASFGMYGYAAIHGRENINVSNPYYHTTGDSIGGGFNADTMCFKGIQAALATVATLAIPYQQPGISDRPSRVCAEMLSMTVYPSIQPRAAGVTVAGYTPWSGILTLCVYDAAGRCVYGTSQNAVNPGRYSFTLPVDLQSGVYVVRLATARKSMQQKLIICR